MTSNSSDTIKDNYIPGFSNKPADYREYRARVSLYKRKMERLKRPKEATINLLTSLTGTASKLVEHDSDKLIESSGTGFDEVIRLLDRSFKYDQRVECPRALDKFFYQLLRRSEQTLMSYITEFRDARREIEKHNIQLPEEVLAYILLKRAGLTQEQKQLVMTQVGTDKMTESNMEEALYFLFGQDYRGRAHDTNPKARANPAGSGNSQPMPWTMMMTTTMKRSISMRRTSTLSMSTSLTMPRSWPL